MLSRNQIQHVRQLHQAKFRKARNAFIAEGPKIVREILESGWKVESLYGTDDWAGRNPNHDNLSAVDFHPVTDKELGRISTLKSPNQVLAIISMPEKVAIDTPPDDSPVLVLDGISDPGNMGTIIRSADWFGWPLIVCSEDCVDLYNPKVIQATMGSFLRVDVKYTALAGYLSALPSESLFGSSMEAASIYEVTMPVKTHLVIGSESHGIREEVRQCISNWVSVPGREGNTESLNAAIAASVMVSEISRKLNRP